MLLPPHILAILDRFGVLPETKVALEAHYLAMGSDVFEFFIDLADRAGSPSLIRPEDLESMRASLAGRYVTKFHHEWLEGKPTRSFWHPRTTEGRAAGLVAPLGTLGDREGDYAGEVTRAVRRLVGEDQPLPEGMVLFGKNAHFGGRSETVSFDVIPLDLEDAKAIALAEGRQHTVPGSIGETSGTLDAPGSLLLLWEIQPNVLKPLEDRNRQINKVYRQHRNWHVVTLTAALLWAAARKMSIHVVRGDALAATHEVNRLEPVSGTIAELYDRTLNRVASSLGFQLLQLSAFEEELILESELMNSGLRRRVEKLGVESSIRKLSRE